MECKQAKQLIPFAADGVLDEPRMQRLTDHLSSCAACSQLYADQCDSLRNLDTAIRNIALDISVPDSFASAIADRIREDTLSQNRITRLSEWFSNICTGFVFNRRASIAAACVTALLIMAVIGGLAKNLLNSAPVATSNVSSGHLVVFTVNPRQDGNIEAGVNA